MMEYREFVEELMAEIKDETGLIGFLSLWRKI